jgi:hypothetical protein
VTVVGHLQIDVQVPFDGFSRRVTDLELKDIVALGGRRRLDRGEPKRQDPQLTWLVERDIIVDPRVFCAGDGSVGQRLSIFSHEPVASVGRRRIARASSEARHQQAGQHQHTRADRDRPDGLRSAEGSSHSSSLPRHQEPG